MTKKIAEEIAILLNERNQLVKQHTSESVLAEKENYVFISESKKIIACAESKKVQWYQWEISHVCVAADFEGKGNGSKILKLAEDKAIKGGAKILQSTIRTDNENSIRLFSRKGYKQINCFFYPISGNWVFVYQKCVSIK